MLLITSYVCLTSSFADRLDNTMIHNSWYICKYMDKIYIGVVITLFHPIIANILSKY